ncbi:hypothetical protein E4U52_000996, partial [Claviceps spartinae]
PAYAVYNMWAEWLVCHVTQPTTRGRDMGRMRSAALDNCLRGLEIVPKESEEDKREQLSAAYGARTIVYFGAP